MGEITNAELSGAALGGVVVWLVILAAWLVAKRDTRD